MTKIILSIKPKYIEQIFSGAKIFELRRVLPKNLKKGDWVLMYATGTGHIAGEFRVERVFRGMQLNRLWGMTTEKNGVTVNEFSEYFKDRRNQGYMLEFGNAIEIADSSKWWDPKPLFHFGLKKAPQNFCYLER